jgi:2-hydroxychromene-2-carboxylate isomerase
LSASRVLSRLPQPVLLFGQSQVKRLGVQIVYTPVDIVSVMKKVTNQPSTMCPPKAKYAGIDSARWARHYDIPFSPNGGRRLLFIAGC